MRYAKITLLTGCFTLLAMSRGTEAQVTEGEKWIGSSLSDHDHFGRSVAISDPYAVVGAPYDDASGGDAGAAYVFARTGSSWQEQAKLLPQSGAGGYFGLGVAITGGTIVVGSHGADSPEANRGAAYLYELNAGTWVQANHLVAYDGEADDEFGWAVAVSASTLAISAIRDDDQGADSGAVYVYSYQAPFGWLLDSKLAPSSLGPGDLFGNCIALDETGTCLVVGARRNDYLGVDAGCVFLFEKLSGCWQQTAQIHATNGNAGDLFGHEVAIADHCLAVGAVWRDSIGTANSGAVYVYEPVSGSWTETACLTIPWLPANAEMGVSCAIAADRVLCGAWRADGASTDCGAVFSFSKLNGVWKLYDTLYSSDGAQDDRFGVSMSSDGGQLLIGDHENDEGAHDAGAAYLFDFAQPDHVTLTCFCDDPFLAPCSNSDTVAGCINSLGKGGHLNASGTASVTADDLVLTSTQLPPNQFGLMFMGQIPKQVPFRDGQLCIGQGGTRPIYRFPAQATGAAGSYTFGPGIVAHSQQHFLPYGVISAGLTYRFQVWYRDPLGPCGSGSNLTNAASVVFQP